MSMKYECASSIDMMEVDNEWIVMDTENFTITKLNQIGALILEEIKDNCDLEDIIEKIATNFSVDINIVESDIQAFLEDLERIGLIKNES